MGRLTGAADATHSLSWAYDDQGRVVSKTQIVGGVARAVSYTYANGNLVSLLTPSGQLVTYGYTQGRVSSIAVNGQPLLSGVSVRAVRAPAPVDMGECHRRHSHL